METKKVKIIWHFKSESLTKEYVDNVESKIKSFYEDSLIVFAEDLDIIILKE